MANESMYESGFTGVFNAFRKGSNQFAAKTVDSVIAQFNKVVADLEQVETNELANAELKDQEAKAALAAKASSEAEAKRASKVATKIKALLTD